MCECKVRDKLIHVFWLLTALLFVGALTMLLAYTPDEQTMGPIQKIFYLHMPVAICTLASCLVCFIGSVGYLITHKTFWDDLASASARVAVQLGAVVLITGMLWAKGVWGVWWTWSPRLTFSLVLWLLYVVYLMVRSSIESGQRRAVISAVYGLIAFLDVPLVYLSARLIKDYIHPASIKLETSMQLTLLAFFVPVMLVTAGLIATRCGLNRRLRALQPRGFEVLPPAAAKTARGAL
ncbi:MAG TPA: cytochrome c biogenesis protein [Tepidisphaeraceae bacterium]|jgi:heme exporter protein C